MKEVPGNFDNYQLRFYGFHPSEFTRSHLDEKMREFYEEAPYGSTIRASFTRLDGRFRGVVRITSAGGAFFASAEGPRVREVARQLEQQLRRQIGKWKTLRFRHESLRHLTPHIRESGERGPKKTG